ncbi:MAG: tetratricopeptide repeat protein [Lentisphaerae bacterium]|nr:tetratricopeptide repeat protein [Lentisphaerota bacterium]
MPGNYKLFYMACGLMLISLLPAEGLPAGSELLTDSRAALEDELYEVASAKLKSYLQQAATPQERFEGILLLLQALHGQKRHQDMLELLEQTRPMSAGLSPADALEFWRALAFFEQGQWALVAATCRQLEQQHPQSSYRSQALRLQAWSLIKQGQTNAALECFAQLAGQYPAAAEAQANRLDWAEVLINAGNLSAAREVLEGLPGINPATPIGQEYLCLLGRIYLKERSFNKARTAYAPLVKLRNVPDEYRAFAYLALAEIAIAQTNPVEALSLLDEGGAKLTTPYLSAICNLHKGKLLLQMDKLEEGIALVHGFVAQQSTNALARQAQLELAQTLLDKGLPEKALLDFQNYLEMFSDPVGTARAQRGKALALYRLSRFNEAAAAFEKAGEAAQGSLPKALDILLMGDARAAAGQYKSAIESYSRVSALVPETAVADQAELQIAECCLRLGEVAQAAMLFEELVDKNPEGELAPAAMLRLADIELGEGRLGSARRQYTAIARSYSGAIRSHALYGLGLIEYRAERFEAALDYFAQARSVGPTSSIADRASYMGAWCLLRLGREDQAIKTFQAFIQHFPDSTWAPDAQFWLSEHDYNAGRHHEAENGFLATQQRYPRSALADAVLFWAGRAALLQNEFRRANNHFTMLIKEYPLSPKRPEARYYQAAALCELGEFAAAILIYDDLIKQFPDHELKAGAFFRKGDCQFTLGSEDPKRYAEALATYQAILEWPDVAGAARLQAEYKIGRCLEKTAKAPEAFERYLNAVYLYYKLPDQRPEDAVWFTRAAFQAAALKESEKSWRKAAAIYQRVVDADVPAGAEASERIARLRAEHWLNFY